MTERGKRAAQHVTLWSGAVIGMLVLTACGGSVPITATAFVTVTSGVPTLGANVAPPASPTEPLALTPAITLAASPAFTATVGTAPTPTPLVNGLLTPTVPSAMGTMGTASTTNATDPPSAANVMGTATPAPNTAVTGSTSGTRVVSTAGTAIIAAMATVANVTGATTTSGTRVTGTAVSAATAVTTVATAAPSMTGVTTATATRPATTPGGATATTTRGSTTASEPTDTPVPTTFARGTAEQFLNAVTKKGDLTGFLTPALHAQTGNDGYKLLNIPGTITKWEVISEKADADGNGAVVHVTVTTAMGAVGHDLHMKKSGMIWVVDSVS